MHTESPSQVAKVLVGESERSSRDDSAVVYCFARGGTRMTAADRCETCGVGLA